MQSPRNLLKELKEPVLRLSREEYSFSCALESPKPCCGGSGLKVSASGPTLVGRLCDCVQNCKRCFGLSRYQSEGRSHACRSPSPQVQMRLLNQAAIPSRYAGASLDRFANRTGNCESVVKLLKNWLTHFKMPCEKGLLLSGRVGVGKTYILAALALGLVRRGFSVKFVDFFQLLTQLKAAYADDRGDAAILGPLGTVDVLLIDELGKGRCSDWELSVLDQMVMGRYNQRKVIVASTNYGLKASRPVADNSGRFESDHRGFSLDELESLEYRVEQRIFSRLAETSVLLELKGEDFRRQLASGLLRLQDHS